MKTLTHSLRVLAAGAVAAAFASCSNYRTDEANSAATGALIGAGVGAAVSDNPLRGAAVGGAAGGGAGYLYGASR